MSYANSDGLDQPAYLYSLIRAFLVHLQVLDTAAYMHLIEGCDQTPEEQVDISNNFYHLHTV